MLGCGRAFLNTIGYALVMEAPGNEYVAAQNAAWTTLRSWRSNQNPELAIYTFYITFALLLAVGGYATFKAVSVYALAEKK